MTVRFSKNFQLLQIPILSSTLMSLAVVLSMCARAQDEWQNLDPSWLQEVMPQADSFSDKQGDPLAIHAYRQLNGEQILIGYLFTSPDIPPEEIGYSGPIDLLLGINLDGEITGVKALHYEESHRLVRGDFITESGFLDQLTGKSLADNFRPGEDIDGMSRATISSWAVARSVRETARRIAVAYLPGSSYALAANEQATALQFLQAQSWSELIESGYVREMAVPIEGENALHLAIAYMGHFRLGELLIGASDYSNADRTASGMVEDGHMMLIGLRGNTSRLQQLRLGGRQDGVVYPNQDNRLVFAGTARDGKITGQAQHAVALFLNPAIDITRPFSLLYDISPRVGAFEDVVEIDYQLPETVVALVQGLPTTNETANPAAGFNWTQIAPVFLVLVLLALALRLAPTMRRHSN